MALERVQKILAHAGIASRRKAEELIEEGAVTINGKVAKLGDKADFEKDAIKVSGKLLRQTQTPVYLAFHKPKAVISMMEDPQGRPTLADYLVRVRGRVFPIGRMDYNSEGLLLLTNDGDFAEKLQKREDVPRTYHVKVKGQPDTETLTKLEKGLKAYQVRVDQKLQSKSVIEITLLSSKTVDLKTAFERRGLLVEKVKRVAIGQITLKGIEAGQYKMLRKSQVQALLDQPELGLPAKEEKKPASLPLTLRIKKP